MNNDQLRDFLSKLESSTDYDAAESQLSEGEPELFLTGNRDALLLFAAAFLRAATAPIPNGECRAAPALLEHHQIIDSEADHILRAVQLIDQLPEDPEIIAIRKRNAWRADRFCLLGCATISFISIFVIMGSAMLWWDFFTGDRL